MSIPTLTKAGVTTVTFDSEDLLPVEEVYQKRSITHVTESGNYVVIYRQNPVRVIHLEFKYQSATVKDNLINFLQHSNVYWSQSSFTYTDSGGNTHTVYYVEQSLTYDEIINEKYNIELTLIERNF